MTTLRRTRDGAGFTGSLVSIFVYGEGWHYDVRPKVGSFVRVGTVSASTYGAIDYWTTTEVTEILHDEPDYMIFKTSNSVYELGYISKFGNKELLKGTGPYYNDLIKRVEDY